MRTVKSTVAFGLAVLVLNCSAPEVSTFHHKPPLVTYNCIDDPCIVYGCTQFHQNFDDGVRLAVKDAERRYELCSGKKAKGTKIETQYVSPKGICAKVIIPK